MKVFAQPRLAVAPPVLHFRARIAQYARRAASRMAALNVRIDAAHAQRDRTNQENHTVDSAFWIYLR